jgi:tRNA threonylcarbamoyladenosine biosynthesis protein TsaE
MNSEKRVISRNQLPSLATNVVELAKNLVSDGAVVLALHGDLGAGKTTFVQALGQALGVSEQITSPTFTIMKSYETSDVVFQNLIHMDAYRIDDISELGPLRFTEILTTPNTIFCIEWAEKIASTLPVGVINISLQIADENTRTVHITHD